MTDTLPDLRVTIAESMEALAHQTWRTPEYLRRPGQTSEQALANYRGADTLRWCAEREAPTIEEMQAEIDQAWAIVKAVAKAVDAPGQTMAQRMQAIREAVA